jgi:tight adherence protein B
MLVAGIVFVVVAGLVLAGYLVLERRPGARAARQLEQRLRELSARAASAVAADGSSVISQTPSGPLPSVDRLIDSTGAGGRLAGLIEQSGVRTSPSAVIVQSILAAVAFGAVALVLARRPDAAAGAGLVGLAVPLARLRYSRSSRMKRFEEQFPEALDLLSRAIRAGHAFQTAMGMVADELPAPVGAEFRKTFEQQNYGLPVTEALAALSARVPLVDVRFFVTAVTIQRETGGNLAEILDNLAVVVRERFKILRQVRVHTAHGRFTGYVLLAMPAALAVALSFINPDHMNLLFKERIGQSMILGAIVMQAVGFVWIRQVIKIEV